MAERGYLISDTLFSKRGDDFLRAAPGWTPILLKPGSEFEGDPAKVEAVFFSGDLFPDRLMDFVQALPKLPAMRWLHTFSAGIDNPLFQSLLERGVRVTTSSGANAPAVAQLAIATMLALTRQLHTSVLAQRDREWAPCEGRDMEGERLVIVGMGPIGLEVAEIAKALRMDVLGVRRTVKGDEGCETWPLSRLHEALAEADQLLLALPIVPDTRHIIGREEIALMKETALVFNVGRGELIEEPELIAALSEGRLAGAGLDVFEEEPLPEDNPLWSMPNVIMTPHHGGYTPAGRERAVEYFLENLAAYVQDAPLRNEAERPPG